MTPDQYCEQKTRQSGSSFYYSFLFLPKDKRRAMTALYAFCREVDDVVDECTDMNVARMSLAWWRGQVNEIYDGTPQHPVALALVPVVRQFSLDKEHLLEIIAGMEMDLYKNRYDSFEELKLYCYRVASVVGLLSARIFGYSDEKTLIYAHDLGIAFQLTNIIRDVGEDAQRGRIYLPQDEMKQYGIHVNDVLNYRESPEFIKLMQFQVERAQQYYRQALAELPPADRKAQRTGLIMAAIYRTTLDEVVDSGLHVLREHVSLPAVRKLWLAFKTWLRN